MSPTPPPESPRVVVVGGGPGGYEAALVAARHGARVTLVEAAAPGGSAVLTDAVPSKTLIATAEWMTIAERAPELGVGRLPDAAARPGPPPHLDPEGDGQAVVSGGVGPVVDLGRVNARVLELAAAQSADIRARLEGAGVEVTTGTGRLESGAVVVRTAEGERTLAAEAVLLSVGARPRVLPTAVPDGDRILSWTQVYGLRELPERLVVVGSGVTGAEFAGAFNALGADVALVSSRDRVLPGEDADAAAVIEEVFRSRGMEVLGRSRAERVERAGDGVAVHLADGRVVTGSHALMAVGSVPATSGLGLEEAGVRLSEAGHVVVDRVSRTSARGVYAAGDCTGVLPLASVAAKQGRIAMAHALGDAVTPLDLGTVASTVFTAPEIARVGASEAALDADGVRFRTAMLELGRNPRAKMLGIHDGFVKMFAHEASGAVLGAVVVAPRAGELIFPLSIAVAQRMTVDELAGVVTVYPSLSGSIAEVARMLR